MEEEKSEYFKNILIKEREKIVKIIEGIDKSWSKNIRESIGNHTGYATHMADLATDSDEREKDTYMLEREFKNLKAHDQALKRIYTQSYGICSKCGKEITEERLRTIPHTDLCINCKRNEERINYNNRKI
ncbi:MAG: TraR/DksA C4-type zinc finger protein [Candidatus Cloacimonetes bacterium]|nr:TraR/DksA C4-type zinc finger protein [Candidatus Cloacimonadota bacterium]MBL7086229.1 TraR/DksA C4-type zinc finger protein [Candidatus Cloacimonadota bacterium]